jgi:sortase (surface protein transpeptidase)
VIVVGPGPGEQPARAAADAPGGVPVSLRIDDLDVEADVLEVGVAPDGSLEVPDRVSDVGWFRDGVRPGEAGSAVLVGHVDAASQGPGAFFLLREAAIGGRISVLDDHGTRQEFEIVARREYRKAELPVDSLFGRGGPAVLTLITCGGEFDSQTRSYDSNIVVHAVPVTGADGQAP